MVHSALRPGQSRRQVSQISSLLIALSLLVAAPAFAKKKPVEEAPPRAEPEAAPADPKLVPPTPDTFGRVHFGPSSAPDLGRVSVKAPAGDNIRVFLEGRFFGNAPLTIYSVPKGDYIVEGTYPDGKTVSKGVSVMENDESIADLTGARAASDASKNAMASHEMSETRLMATKAFIIGGGVALVLGVTFGVLEIMKESDYKNAPNDTAKLDSISSTGKTYALLANVGYVLALAGGVGAAICAYPMFVKPNVEKKTVAMASRPIFVVVPANSGATGSMTMRF